MNTCDQAQVWTTSHCQDQDHPQLTVQNLTFADGNSTGQTDDGGGGGAIFVRGGRFKVVDSHVHAQPCDPTGPDLGGGALRVLSQSQGLPVYVVNSTFGGSGQGNPARTAARLSSIGVSWVVLNSVLSDNTAIGRGANPARGRHARRRQRRRHLPRRQPVHPRRRRHRSSRTTTPTRAAAPSSS